MLGGTIVAIEPKRRIEMTFEPAFFGPGAPASHCIYEIETIDDGCRFTVLHFGIPEGQHGVMSGWGSIAERIKVYAEQGSVDAITKREQAA